MKKSTFLLIAFIAVSVFSCVTTESENPEITSQIKIQNKSEEKNPYLSKGVQVINQEAVNLEVSEAAWLPGQIQDKLKSNLQEYLGMKTVVDSKSETALKKLQAESESEARDEDTAIELGKITTAKYALFTKIRKTGNGYTVSADFTDLTTGEQLASVTSKEYSKAEYLYGTTGAADEITLLLGDKLQLEISSVVRQYLNAGSTNFSVDAQLKLAKENEEKYQKMMKDYDAELSRLLTSDDINAIQDKKRIEAEKALLSEKQNAEKKRQEELKEQKARSEADAKLEAERSIALKTQRDQMAKEAAAKAEEVRKLKMEKQGVLGQINLIEAKKKALVEIRQSVEKRDRELFVQLEADRKNESLRIWNKTYSTVELGSDGYPTRAAKERRERQVIKSYEELTEKFFADCEAVKASTREQEKSLLKEISEDQKLLKTTRTVSSMGDELKVSVGVYEGSQNGWNAYLSLYSEGVLLYTDSFIVKYEALSGKKAPDMATELDDAVIEEYTDNVDMYNSLLTRGDPVIYFEIDYNVTAEGDDKPSEYNFNFNTVRVINTVSGKTIQTSSLNKSQPGKMKTKWNIQDVDGVAAQEKKYFNELKKNIAQGMSFEAAQKKRQDDIDAKNSVNEFYNSFVKIPGRNFIIQKTEVTQNLYVSVMGKVSSSFRGGNKPIGNVSWYDAIYFCNKLSEKYGLKPVYSVDGKTDVTQWYYAPHRGDKPYGVVVWNKSADGFRLPTGEEWEYAARGGEKYKYSGSNDLNEVAWYLWNSGEELHPVAQKKPNGYGLYDMSGNAGEWVWESDYSGQYRYFRGGSYIDFGTGCMVNKDNITLTAKNQANSVGFRIVRSYFD